MSSRHERDDRWLAALSGQAEPDDADTHQAASLRRYLELQDDRETPLERKAAGRMARRLQAGLAAAHLGNTGQATRTPTADRPGQAGADGSRTMSPARSPSSSSGRWTRWWAWCFPPLPGHGGHYAGAGALAAAVISGLVLATGWWPRSDRPSAIDERLAVAEPAGGAEPKATAPQAQLDPDSASTLAVPKAAAQVALASTTAAPASQPVTAAATTSGTNSAGANKAAPRLASARMGATAEPATAAATAATTAQPGLSGGSSGGSVLATAESRAEAARSEQLAALSQRRADAAPAARMTRETMAGADKAAQQAQARSMADAAQPAPDPATEAITSTARARPAAPPVPVPVPVPVPAPAMAATISAKARTAASTTPAGATPAMPAAASSSNTAPRQQLSVPRPADAAAQIEELLQQQDVAYAIRIDAGVWLIDANVAEAKRQKLIEPLRKFRIELPDDGRLRVRVIQAR